jgi:hypothetical protein
MLCAVLSAALLGVIHQRGELYSGVELVALALGLFGIAEFLKSINRIATADTTHVKVRLRDMQPSREDLKRVALPILWLSCRASTTTTRSANAGLPRSAARQKNAARRLLAPSAP